MEFYSADIEMLVSGWNALNNSAWTLHARATIRCIRRVGAV
jgi:hypothetical protein